MPSKTIVSIVAIVAIVITALLKDINGWIVFSSCSLIAGLGGFAYGKYKK